MNYAYSRTHNGSYQSDNGIYMNYDSWGMPKAHYQDHHASDVSWDDAIDIRSYYEDGGSDAGEAVGYVRLDRLSYRELDGTADARDIYYNYPTVVVQRN